MTKKEMGLLSETESLERLLYRLPENHPKRQFLQVELFRTAAGKRGEKRLEQKLKEFRLPKTSAANCFSMTRQANSHESTWKASELLWKIRQSN